MFKVNWSSLAQRNFVAIVDFLLESTPKTAKRVVDRIDQAISLLKTQPYMGRVGRVGGTRELVISQTPYIAVCLVEADAIKIIRLLDVRQLWPQQLP